MPIPRKKLKTLFEAMFHDKYSFEEFLQKVSSSDFDRTFIRRDNKQREIVNPNSRLRAFHNFLRLFMVEFLPVCEESVFSYRRGVGTYSAVEKHSQSHSFFISDIESFFPSITRDMVSITISNAYAQIPIEDIDDYLEHLLDVMCVDDRLPVGYSTSPGLSNAVLYPFDLAFHAHCKEIDVTYTRYADDIILSSSRHDALELGVLSLNVFLKKFFDDKLRLHPRKSKYMRRGEKIKLLGMTVLPNGKITIDSSVKNQIETMLYTYVKNREGFNLLNEGSGAKPEARLAGLINYANTVDQIYLEKLRRKYGAAIVDMFLHRSFG